MTGLPYRIANSGLLQPLDAHDLDRDPRGIVWIWEEPHPGSVYCVGVDPSVGITSWDRTLRTQDDSKTDNGAIELIRVGRDRDYQVAEYAAPIDPEDLADVANALGRLYGGTDEEGQALCIIEVYPGPGLLTQRRLMNQFGYLNQFVWKYIDAAVPRPTGSYGWVASSKSVPLLWARTARHILKGGLRIRSPWLVEEMADAEIDPQKMWAKAIRGRHDDRLRAMMLAVWAAHEWSLDIESEKTEVNTNASAPEWQASDISADKMMEAWEERWAELSE